MTITALVINNGQMTETVIDNTLQALQTQVDGYISAAFTFQRPGSETEITGYVNDEGLLMQLPITTVVKYPNGYESPMAGPMVIVGLDEEGETIGLSAEDVQFLREHIEHLPMYLYEGQYLFIDVFRIAFPAMLV